MYKILTAFSFSLFTFLAVGANGVKSEEMTVLSVEETKDSTALENVKRVSVLPLDTINNMDFLGKVSVKGQARFNMIYRNMDESYSDMVTADKNLAFTDYPVVGAGAQNSSGQPFVDLIMNMQPARNFSFDIGYAMYHTFNGQADSVAKAATVRTNLNFGARLRTDYGLFRIRAGGGVLWTQMSPLTISGNEGRRDNFDRLPWDWYTDSWKKYNDFFSASNNLGSESYGNQAFQGFQMMGDGLPGNFGFTAMYGRTNQSIDQALADFYPSAMAAGRIYNYIGNAKVGLNGFNQKNYLSNSSEVVDSRVIGSVDVEYLIKGVRFYMEAGMGKVDNPLSDNKWGEAIILQTTIPESKFKLPINFQLYRVTHNVASNVSSVFNSNANAPSQGLRFDKDGKQDLTYNTTLFVNPMMEVGQVANNRQGMSVSTGKAVGKNFHIELGWAISQELNNDVDVVTFGHKAFAFSRSRFNPWVFTAGPYQKVQNAFRMANERVNITDSETGLGAGGYQKGFATLDLAFKYKTSVLGKGLIFKWYNTYSSVNPGLILLPTISNVFDETYDSKAFVRSYYTQFMAFLNVSKRISLVGMVEIEKTTANNRTDLSSYNRKPIDQLGQGWGYGIDYDFSDFAGIYFRHRWMKHEDINFIKDRFNGQEMTVELKVFF